MTIETKQDGTTMTFVISGWVDTMAAPELETAISSIPDEVQSLIMDCGNTEYISSSGIRQIVAAHKKMNGNLTLQNVPAEILNVLKMTGIAKRIHIE